VFFFFWEKREERLFFRNEYVQLSKGTVPASKRVTEHTERSTRTKDQRKTSRKNKGKITPFHYFLFQRKETMDEAMLKIVSKRKKRKKNREKLFTSKKKTKNQRKTPSKEIQKRLKKENKEASFFRLFFSTSWQLLSSSTWPHWQIHRSNN